MPFLDGPPNLEGWKHSASLVFAQDRMREALASLSGKWNPDSICEFSRMLSSNEPRDIARLIDIVMTLFNLEPLARRRSGELFGDKMVSIASASTVRELDQVANEVLVAWQLGRIAAPVQIEPRVPPKAERPAGVRPKSPDFGIILGDGKAIDVEVTTLDTISLKAAIDAGKDYSRAVYDRFDQALVGKHKQVGDLHPAMIVLCVTDRSFDPQSLLEAIVARAFANPLYGWISLLAVYSGRFSYRADESDPELHVRANHRAKRPVPAKFHHALAGRIVIRDGMMVVRESNADFNNGSNYPFRR